jgi:cytoskeleton protein RodZ
VLIGLTALWWQQDNKQNTSLVINAPDTEAALNENSEQVASSTAKDSLEKPVIETQTVESNGSAEQGRDQIDMTKVNEAIAVISLGKENQTGQVVSETLPEQSLSEQHLPEQQEPTESPLRAKAVLTFSGDCWVNIYDATGERIAWGIKKSGYVMTIEGIAPFRITLGKPELASIIFNDKPVDMSTFNPGNIATFTLPLTL